MVERTEIEDVYLTVKFFGEGPFSVRWYHDDKELKCSNNTADKTQCTVKRFSNSSYGYEVDIFCGSVLHVYKNLL